jgi:hypothetical protein
MKNLLLMGLLSALGAGGALAAERSHFEHFITRDGPAGAAGVVFNAVQLRRVDPGEAKHLIAILESGAVDAPELHRIEDDARGPCRADPRGWGQYFKWPTAQEKHLIAILESGAVASDKVFKMRALGGQRPAGPQRLSALGAGGALAAERSHFEHFITRDGAALKDGDKVIKCSKCERSAASAPPAPSADSSPISSRFFIGFSTGRSLVLRRDSDEADEKPAANGAAVRAGGRRGAGRTAAPLAAGFSSASSLSLLRTRLRPVRRS